jgi:hypothetical protein
MPLTSTVLAPSAASDLPERVLGERISDSHNIGVSEGMKRSSFGRRGCAAHSSAAAHCGAAHSSVSAAVMNWWLLSITPPRPRKNGVMPENSSAERWDDIERFATGEYHPPALRTTRADAPRAALSMLLWRN